MPILLRPTCPNCGSAGTRLVKSAAGLAQLTAATATAFFVADLVPMVWRCPDCGQQFLATGDRACGATAPRGFPINEAKERSNT